MLHHSNSRNQRNRGSRIKTLLQATLLLGVILWLLYQVKHSYDKKNEYLDDAEDQLAHNDRSMFQGRKEKAGSYSDSNMEMVGDNSDVITKPVDGAADHHSDTFDHNEKSGETVFDKDSTDLHEDDKRNTERSEAEEGQVSNADGNTEAQSNNNEDETTGHAEEDKHDTESNSETESKSEVNSAGDDMSQNNHAQEENNGETSGTSHDGVVQGDESTSASGNGSDGEGEKKEAVDTLLDDAKTETTDDHTNGSLPDETGNIPSVHTENSQNVASENQGDTASTTTDSSENGIREAVHIETGLEDESATTSVETRSGSGDDKGNSSDITSAEENTETASGDDEKGAETGTSNEVSNSENSSAGTDQASNTESEITQGDSSGGGVNSSEEMSNKSDGATETSNNGGQVDAKIETSTSTNDEHNESQGGDGGSRSNDSNGSGPEQTGKSESQ